MRKTIYVPIEKLVEKMTDELKGTPGIEVISVTLGVEGISIVLDIEGEENERE